MNQSALVSWVFPAVVFICTVVMVVGVYLLFARDRLKSRLSQVVGISNDSLRTDKEGGNWIKIVAAVTAPLAKLSTPEDRWEDSGIRRRFMQAGLRHPAAPGIFFGLKSVLAFGLPFLGYFLVRSFSPTTPLSKLYPLLVMLAVVGYYACNFFLNRMIEARKQEIFETFPDALDLLTICVEAGLGLDAAIGRVAAEMRLGKSIVSEELSLVSLDLRAGSSKDRALRNFALRTGVEDVESLVAVLIQAEKFGTTIGASLRIHSDILRTKRMQRAEEKAAKISVKLLFPLIFCIFPALMVVLLGPSMIQIVTILPTMIK
jgi:tight adherence protein C